jgi:hypothetical protein
MQSGCSPELNELFTALAKAQSEMRTAGKESKNLFLKSKYADLVSVVAASRPYLAKNGLSVMQSMEVDDSGRRILVTILGHSSGQYVTSRIDVPCFPSTEKQFTLRDFFQSFGAAVTYLRRYSYASLVGVVADDEDDDGASISQRTYQAPPPPVPSTKPLIPITKEECDILERELADNIDLAQNILDKYNLKSLADIPKSHYYPILDRVREIKANSSSK